MFTTNGNASAARTIPPSLASPNGVLSTDGCIPSSNKQVLMSLISNYQVSYELLISTSKLTHNFNKQDRAKRYHGFAIGKIKFPPKIPVSFPGNWIQARIPRGGIVLICTFVPGIVRGKAKLNLVPADRNWRRVAQIANMILCFLHRVTNGQRFYTPQNSF